MLYEIEFGKLDGTRGIITGVPAESVKKIVSWYLDQSCSFPIYNETGIVYTFDPNSIKEIRIK